MWNNQEDNCGCDGMGGYSYDTDHGNPTWFVGHTRYAELDDAIDAAVMRGVCVYDEFKNEIFDPKTDKI